MSATADVEAEQLPVTGIAAGDEEGDLGGRVVGLAGPPVGYDSAAQSAHRAARRCVRREPADQQAGWETLRVDRVPGRHDLVDDDLGHGRSVPRPASGRRATRMGLWTSVEAARWTEAASTDPGGD